MQLMEWQWEVLKSAQYRLKRIHAIQWLELEAILEEETYLDENGSGHTIIKLKFEVAN